MIEEILKTLLTANAVTDYAKVNGYDTAGINNLLVLWEKLKHEDDDTVNG